MTYFDVIQVYFITLHYNLIKQKRGQILVCPQKIQWYEVLNEVLFQ